MNYIKQLNEFYNTLDFNPISANAISLYIILVCIANKANWISEFTVANITLLSKCKLNMSSMQRARNELVQKGYVYYQKGKNQNDVSKYTIIKLYGFEQANEQANEQASEQANEQAPDLAPEHINKQNKTKQNNKVSKKESDTMQSFNSIIENYTNNTELQTELKNHLKTRKAKKATLTNRAIELSLNNLDKLGTNDDEKIELVKYAIMRGWTGFFPLPNDYKKIEIPKEEKIDYSAIPWAREHPLYDPAYEDGGYADALRIMEEMKNEKC